MCFVVTRSHGATGAVKLSSWFGLITQVLKWCNTLISSTRLNGTAHAIYVKVCYIVCLER